MQSDRELFLEFQQKWSKEKVQNMSLEEYTGLGGNRSDFAFWTESILDKMGSIWGGYSIKFGIYKYKSKKEEYKKTFMVHDDKYAWHKKYGNTAQEAFENVKNEILKIIEFSQNNELEKIDEVDLMPMYKWKIAFHYQNPDDMKILDIFSSDIVKKIYEKEFKMEFKNIYDFHKKILPDIQKFTLEEVLNKARYYHEKYPEFFRGNKNSKLSNDEDFKEEKITKMPQGENMKNFPLNQILYGPPGTGKTYEVVNLALQILGESISENRKENKVKFDKYRQNGQIEFITFHQSYGYEEFVEGIKPVFDDKNSQTTELKYKVEPGIFKKICDKALKNLENSQKSIEQLEIEYRLENLWNNFIANLNNELIEKSEIKFYKTMKIKRIGDNSVFISASSSEQSLSKDIFLRDYKEFKEDKIKNYKDIKPAGQSKAISHGNATYYFELFKQISEFEKNLKIENKDIEKEQEKRYILIIDEINRGNISKIFGELITLIESSKRVGKRVGEMVGESEELKVKLPYSGDEFGVPKNLYIIGTMNTADRSIALLDTALRRRFEFVEMMPKAEILGEIDGINLQELLKAMNERIEFLLGREHTIGHAYFMEVANLDHLRQVFKNKIIPLLQEYFYDDYEKIRAVLNDNDMIKEKSKPKFGSNFDFIDDDKKIYDICEFDEKITAENFKKIYE